MIINEPKHTPCLSVGLRGGNRINKSSLDPNLPSTWSNLTHLVMVAGHTVHQDFDYVSKPTDPSSWFLFDYQKKQLPLFLDHAKIGVEIAGRDDSSLVLFSGASHHVGAGPQTEGMSYWYYADSQGWWGYEEAKLRIHSEEFARDSFENLLFSVCRFKQMVGSYPSKITVVGFKFKENRFSTLHREAIGFPKSRFYYVSGKGEHATETEIRGELENAVSHFKDDPFGCGQYLAKKKAARNTQRKFAPYPKGCEEIAVLFSYCSKYNYDGNDLPWSNIE